MQICWKIIAYYLLNQRLKAYFFPYKLSQTLVQITNYKIQLESCASNLVLTEKKDGLKDGRRKIIWKVINDLIR